MAATRCHGPRSITVICPTNLLVEIFNVLSDIYHGVFSHLGRNEIDYVVPTKIVKSATFCATHRSASCFLLSLMFMKSFQFLVPAGPFQPHPALTFTNVWGNEIGYNRTNENLKHGINQIAEKLFH